MKILSFDFKKKQFTSSQGKNNEVFPVKKMEDADLDFLKILWSMDKPSLFTSSINDFCMDMKEKGFNFVWVAEDFFINADLLEKKGKFYYRQAPKGQLKFKKQKGRFSLVETIVNE